MGTPHAGTQMQSGSSQGGMQASPSMTEGQSGPDQTNAFHGGIGADGVNRNADGNIAARQRQASGDGPSPLPEGVAQSSPEAPLHLVDQARRFQDRRAA